MALSTRERAVLDLEREWWQLAPTKKQAIAERLGCSQAVYYSTLRHLAASTEAFRYSPLVVQRLRRRMARDRRDRVVGQTAAAVPYRPVGPPETQPRR
ncbi:MAG: DUF3263 domain-containing protein [Acidimicrobiales bacterium]